MERTMGDVRSGKQRTACSLPLQRAVQFLLYYCDECKKKTKADSRIVSCDYPSQLFLPVCRSIANYSWAILDRVKQKKKKKSKQKDSQVNGTRPKAKHTQHLHGNLFQTGLATFQKF